MKDKRHLLIRIAGLGAGALGAVLLLACSASEPANAQNEGVVHVASAHELELAVRAARPGTRIILADGDYQPVRISNLNAAGNPVTITAENPLKARMSGMNITNSDGLIIDGLHFRATGPAVLFFNTGARNMLLVNSLISGVNHNRNPWDDEGRGVRILGAERITIAHNLFEDLKVALTMRESEGVRVHRNSFQWLREGINIARSKNGALTANYLTEFHPNYAKGEHPDAIQFWVAREPEGSHNFLIARNVMIFGENRAVQGIFIRSETERREIPQIRHSNFLIEHNIYYGSSAHGITANSVEGVRINNNVVVGSPFSKTNGNVDRTGDGRGSRGFTPGIRARFGSGAIFERNVSMAPISMEPDGREADNVVLNPVRGMGKPRNAILAGPITEDLPSLDRFVTKNPQLRARSIGLLDPFPYGAGQTDPAANLQEAIAVHKTP